VTVKAMGYLIHENASSSLINRLHTPPLHCYWTGFERALYHLLVCVQTLCPNPTCSAFRNVFAGFLPPSYNHRINVILNRR
jgi:hypothetical protein